MGFKLQQLDLSPIELKTVGKAYSSLGRLISIVDEREQFINQFIDLKAMETEETSKYCQTFSSFILIYSIVL